jgi:hypothetical protein
LLHLSFRLEEYGIIFDVVVDFTIILHAVRRPECVWASALTSVSGAASLIVFGKPLVEGSQISLCWRSSKVLFPVFFYLLLELAKILDL